MHRVLVRAESYLHLRGFRELTSRQLPTFRTIRLDFGLPSVNRASSVAGLPYSYIFRNLQTAEATKAFEDISKISGAGLAG